MFAGFTLVAMQMSTSPYITNYYVGVLGLPMRLSNVVHSVAAVIAFGAMTLWILVCFNKSNLPADKQTPQKKLRNKLYTILGTCMIASLYLFALYLAGLLSANFPIVFVVEFLMLTFGGIACLIKGGMFLKDVEE